MLQGKVVLVTGAGGAIGRDFALAMPAMRAHFYPLERSEDVFSWDPA